MLLLRGLGHSGLAWHCGPAASASWGRRWNSAEAAIAPPRPTAPRTPITSPAQHTAQQLGLWYTMPPEIVRQLFSYGGLKKEYTSLCQTFAETCLMVREPALTAIDLIRRCDLSLPPNKLFFYGRDGCGKTLSLAHTAHYLAESGWLLVHIPWAPNWRRFFKEVAPSTTIPGRYNHPLDATIWLQHFKTENGELIKSLKLETQQEYVWSKREIMAPHIPLLELVDLGIARARYSTDIVFALVSELKTHAIQDRCKVAVVIDGINTFFSPVTRHRREDRSIVGPEHFTLFQAFMQLFGSDWKNGVMLGTLDRIANEAARRESHLPRYVLRQKGWETLDPFVPIPVDDYNEVEMRSAIDYFLDRHWLQNPMAGSDIGRRELATLSAHNPRLLADVCRPL